MILALTLLISVSAFASVETECGVAQGLAISAESMTAYGTSDHFYTNREHAGAVYGTKSRQIDKLVDSILKIAPNLPEKGNAIIEEANALKSGVYRVWVSDTALFNEGINSADASLKAFSRAMKNLCK